MESFDMDGWVLKRVVPKRMTSKASPTLSKECRGFPNRGKNRGGAV